MHLDMFEGLAMSSAVLGILILGTHALKTNLYFYALHTAAIALETAWISYLTREEHLLWIALAVFLIKAILIPIFLRWVIRRIDVGTDAGAFIPAPMSMTLGAFTVGLSYLIASQISGLGDNLDSRLASTAAMSILFTGVLLMLTRRAAISQIVGFLVIENGIYLFTVTQTHGMPLLVEMGLLLEVLVAVMVAGLLLFNIKKSFEHIDVSQLTELKE